MLKIREILCRSAIGKCGFPGGGFCINPYVGCGHGCQYCYARFMRRFTGHTEEWGSFVDVRTNIAELLKKQIRSPKYKKEKIFIGTVTDPYQPLERKYQITKAVLRVLVDKDNPVSILTKSDLVLRDVDLLKRFKEVDVNFTINTLDEKWRKLVEPCSPTTNQRLEAAKKLSSEGITVLAMMGPYWPDFTDPDALFREFKKTGITHVFSESFNTIGGNWTGVAIVLKHNYPHLFGKIQKVMFDKKEFDAFYAQAAKKIGQASKKYQIPTTIYFGVGHAAKFK